ncbi:hypothetical protein EVAR_92570_1 [Eumeta japonica]|uniref:Uncharacterized protein n=1 Tax=Eumeta variegata TaxID=151549 RepID=A0A4C1SWM1_EUMVA|nr:hypothetical protein EVAR_92570_1 [Eumeta japonica]
MQMQVGHCNRTVNSRNGPTKHVIFLTAFGEAAAVAKGGRPTRRRDSVRSAAPQWLKGAPLPRFVLRAPGAAALGPRALRANTQNNRTLMRNNTAILTAFVGTSP